MKPRSGINRHYRNFIRAKPCLLSTDGKLRFYHPHCFGKTEFCHIKHAGMGGKDVPDIGNAIPLCMAHHREQHDIGFISFERKHEIHLQEHADRLAREWKETCGAEP